MNGSSREIRASISSGVPGRQTRFCWSYSCMYPALTLGADEGCLEVFESGGLSPMIGARFPVMFSCRCKQLLRSITPICAMPRSPVFFSVCQIDICWKHRIFAIVEGAFDPQVEVGFPWDFMVFYYERKRRSKVHGRPRMWGLFFVWVKPEIL